MWSLKGTPKTYRITSKLARDFAELTPAHGDRPLSERRLAVYRKVLQVGGFRPVTWARAYCKETKETFRVNGGHTSNLFASTDLAKVQDLYATIEEFECDDLSDVARLYSTYDAKSQTRTTSDINHSFASTIPELAEIDSKSINLLVSGLSYADSPTNDGTSQKSPAERAELLFDNVEVCLWAKKILSGGSEKAGRSHKALHLCRAPVVGAMINTYRKAKGDADTFWLAVRDETGTTPELPDRKLARWLLTVKSHMGARGDVPRRFRILAREFYSRSLTAWNAWRTDTPTEVRYFHGSKLPAIK